LTLVCFAAVKQDINNHQSTDRKFRSLTSLEQIEYENLYDVFDILVNEKLRTVTLKGQYRLFKTEKEPINSSLYGTKTKLDFILMYLKENPNQAYHGQLFNISQSKVSEWVSYLLPVLEEALKKMGFMAQSGYEFKSPVKDSQYLLVDVTERQVPRDIDYQNQQDDYSGKKKLHTMKNLAVCDEKGTIHFISDSYQGSTHDKSIWNEIEFDFGELNVLADLGFLGAENEQPNVILPYKKPKNGDITTIQKGINKAIGSVRVKIEHVFSSVKRLKIIRNKIRLKTYETRNQVFQIAVALHNLRVQFRALQINS
jgi:hypothetical protein